MSVVITESTPNVGKFQQIENKIAAVMQKKFNSAKNRKKAIHLASAAGAGIVATLPIGTDVIGLRACEIIMIMLIAESYGEKLTKSAAKGLMLSSFAQAVGEKAAIATLEALEAAKMLTGPVAWGVKAGVAVALIESLGHMVIRYYENPKSLGAKACKVAEGVGLAADVGRVIGLAKGIGGKAQAADAAAETVAAESAGVEISAGEGAGSQISFCGSDILKQIHEQEKKICSQESKIKMIEGWIESDLKFGRDPSQNQIKLEYALKELKALLNELSRLKK